MASAEILNFDSLLAPIAGDNPAGVDLRGDPASDSPYRAIRDARQASVRGERQLSQIQAASQGDDPETVKEAAAARARIDWGPVWKLAPVVLAGRSKDLEIASYLIEVLVRDHGFAGLRDGFRLARLLVERFWDGLYPLPDEEGTSTRVGCLTSFDGDEQVDGALIRPILNIPLSEGRTTGPFAACHHAQAMDMARTVDAEARQRRISRGAVTMEMFQRAGKETPTPFYQTIVEDLEQCLIEFEGLHRLLEEKCGAGPDGYSAAPPSSKTREALQTCKEVLQSLAGDRLTKAQPPAAAGPVGAASNGAPAIAAGSSGGGLGSRDEAFQTLMRVAEYFERSEPQSIVPTAIRNVVRWGRMSPAEFYSELIQDSTVQQFMLRMVTPKQEPSI